MKPDVAAPRRRSTAFADGRSDRPAGIAFRPIADGDRAFLMALYASTREEELRPLPWPDEAKRAFLASQFDLQHRHYVGTFADAAFLLILEHEQPIGRVYLHRSAHELMVIEISLVAERRGHGLGTALLTEVLDEARADGKSVSLHVESYNPAARLYARLGFEIVERGGVYDMMRWTSPATS